MNILVYIIYQHWEGYEIKVVIIVMSDDMYHLAKLYPLWNNSSTVARQIYQINYVNKPTLNLLTLEHFIDIY